jgi:hypothetical protein
MQFLNEGLVVEGLELTTVDILGMSRYTLFSEPGGSKEENKSEAHCIVAVAIRLFNIIP